MRLPRRAIRALSAVTVVLAMALGMPAVAGAAQGIGGDPQNEAVAVNTQDGASVFRLAFSIVHVADGTVDQKNQALAYASCTDCKTVALAFQVVIVMGDANYVAPVNQAGAINDKCTECLTFASATQIVIGVDGPVKLTPEGWRRVILLARRMAELETKLDTLTAAQLAAEVSSIEQELISILSTELVPADTPIGPDGRAASAGSTSTTTSTTVQSVTSTTTTAVDGAASTSTTSPAATTTLSPSTTLATVPADTSGTTVP